MSGGQLGLLSDLMIFCGSNNEDMNNSSKSNSKLARSIIVDFTSASSQLFAPPFWNDFFPRPSQARAFSTSQPSGTEYRVQKKDTRPAIVWCVARLCADLVAQIDEQEQVWSNKIL